MYAIKKSLSSVIVLTTFLLTTSAFAMDEAAEAAQVVAHESSSTFPPLSSGNFSEFPPQVVSLIIEYAAFEQCLNNESPVNLALVCKAWKKKTEYHMQPGRPCYKAWYGVTPEKEHIYQQFLKGVLIYKPDSQSDAGLIKLKISDLINPLDGTFDLSQCGDAGKYLSISTGYRKRMKPENRAKLEIWLAPRFMIENKIQSSASHLQPIMDNWNEATAPIGILQTWGGDDNVAHMTTSSNLTHGTFGMSPATWTPYYHRHRGEVMHYKSVMLIALNLNNFMFICEPK